MTKKQWNQPRAELVSFAANEYFSACRDEKSNERLYNLSCNYASSSQAVIFYLETTGDNTMQYDASGSSATINSLTGGSSGVSNFNSFYQAAANNQYSKTYDQYMGIYNCCGGKHTVAESQVHVGHASTGSRYTQVYIWHNAIGTGLHATKYSESLFSSANAARS